MEQFERYFNVLGIDATKRMRIRVIFDFYKSISEDEIIDIFINTRINKDSETVFDSLFFFTEKSVMEAKSFLTKDQFDLDFLKERVAYWEITKENYDFENATADSRLSIFAKLKRPSVLNLTAEGNNCDELRRIFKKFIVANQNI